MKSDHGRWTIGKYHLPWEKTTHLGTQVKATHSPSLFTTSIECNCMYVLFVCLYGCVYVNHNKAHQGWYLGPVCTMDHEVGPGKMVFSYGPTSMLRVLRKSIYTTFGPLARCKPNSGPRGRMTMHQKMTVLIFLIYLQNG